jgi:hypothetical protein
MLVANGDCQLVPYDLCRNHHYRFADHGVDLARHDTRTRLESGEFYLTKARKQTAVGMHFVFCYA